MPQRDARGSGWYNPRMSQASEIGEEILSTSHDYPDRRVVLHFLACRIAGDPRPQQGQEMRWVPRAELTSLPFPPADEELIRLLSREDGG